MHVPSKWSNFREAKRYIIIDKETLFDEAFYNDHTQEDELKLASTLRKIASDKRNVEIIFSSPDELGGLAEKFKKDDVETNDIFYVTNSAGGKNPGFGEVENFATEPAPGATLEHIRNFSVHKPKFDHAKQRLVIIADNFIDETFLQNFDDVAFKKELAEVEAAAEETEINRNVFVAQKMDKKGLVALALQQIHDEKKHVKIVLAFSSQIDELSRIFKEEGVRGNSIMYVVDSIKPPSITEGIVRNFATEKDLDEKDLGKTLRRIYSFATPAEGAI